MLVPPHPPRAWHTPGIGRVKQWELRIDEQLPTSSAQIASWGEPDSMGVAWHCGSANQLYRNISEIEIIIQYWGVSELSYPYTV
jgi:hypothetical protein